MGVLIIDAAAKKQIAAAIERARDQVMPWAVGKRIAIDDRDKPTARLSLAERRPGTDALTSRSQFLQLGTYMAAISFEEQPAGVLRHLSVSARKPGSIPNEAVMRRLAKEFGFSGFPPHRHGRVWVEEFRPGHHAINVLEVEQATS